MNDSTLLCHRASLKIWEMRKWRMKLAEGVAFRRFHYLIILCEGGCGVW